MKSYLICLDCCEQVLELEANDRVNEENEVGEEPGVNDLVLHPEQSPACWKTRFEQQRAHILELWDICNVSIVHRTQFFLLFKGDLADAIYMEVELRRLTWLQKHLTPDSQCPQNHANTPEEHLLPASPLTTRYSSSSCPLFWLL